MRVPTALHLTLALLLVASLGVGAAATPVAAESSHEPDDYHQVITIELGGDGDAEWTIEDRYALDDEDDVEAFESWAQAVQDGDRDAGYDRATFERFADEAEYETDRTMGIQNAGWDDHRIEDGENGTNAVGVVTYRFTWTNFAHAADGQLTLADTFASEDGTWFPAIEDDQQLVVEAPSNYAFDTVPHGLDGGALVWDGPHEFEEADFEIVLTERPLWGLVSLLPYLGLGLVVIGAAAGLWYLLRSDRERLPESIEEPVQALLGRRSGDPDAADAGTPGAEPDAVERDETSTEPAVADGETLAYDDTTEEEVDPDLLSDEERVHRLLRENGGRMKQASIVKETGWSNAKVSQLLSQMDDDGEIEKLRIGRENLITLPEVDPTEVE